VSSLHTDSSTDLVSGATWTVAVPGVLSFGTEETSDWEETPFSQAHSLPDFVVELMILARHKDLAEVESFPSWSRNAEPERVVGREADCTASVVI